MTGFAAAKAGAGERVGNGASATSSGRKHTLELAELRRRAAVLGISAGVHKTALIRAIQRRLGWEACYGTELRYSCGSSCEWRADCVKPIAEWLR